MATVLSAFPFPYSGSSQEGLNLEPLTSQLYTWSDPTGQREVTWSCGEKKNLKSALDQVCILFK